MTFNTRFLVENPDDIIFTMKITMTAREWCDLRDAKQKDSSYSDGGYLVTRLSQRITDLLADARKTFWKSDDEPEPVKD